MGIYSHSGSIAYRNYPERFRVVPGWPLARKLIKGFTLYGEWYNSYFMLRTIPYQPYHESERQQIDHYLTTGLGVGGQFYHGKRFFTEITLGVGVAKPFSPEWSQPNDKLVAMPKLGYIWGYKF